MELIIINYGREDMETEKWKCGCLHFCKSLLAGILSRSSDVSYFPVKSFVRVPWFWVHDWCFSKVVKFQNFSCDEGDLWGIHFAKCTVRQKLQKSRWCSVGLIIAFSDLVQWSLIRKAIWKLSCKPYDTQAVFTAKRASLCFSQEIGLPDVAFYCCFLAFVLLGFGGAGCFGCAGTTACAMSGAT